MREREKKKTERKKERERRGLTLFIALPNKNADTQRDTRNVYNADCKKIRNQCFDQLIFPSPFISLVFSLVFFFFSLVVVVFFPFFFLLQLLPLHLLRGRRR